MSYRSLPLASGRELVADVTQSPGRFSVRPCVRMRRGGSPYNALAEGCSLGRADPPQEDEADNTEMGTLAVTEELHAKQQEAARKEAERAARKAPQDAAADAKGEAGGPASKKPPGKEPRACTPDAQARGQEGAAGRGCGCEGRSRGTSVQKAAREGAARLHDRCAGAGHEDGRRWF